MKKEKNPTPKYKRKKRRFKKLNQKKNMKNFNLFKWRRI